MSQEGAQGCAEPAEPEAGPPAEPAAAPPAERTSDYYRVDARLPARFNNPAWFRGYRGGEPASVYRTSNQAYGGRAPSVHEMPAFHASCSRFSRQLAAAGPLRSSGLNVGLDRSLVTGPGSRITHCDRLDFQPSYNASRPSICH